MRGFRFSMAALALGGALLPAMPAIAAGETVYRCVMADGKVFYTDTDKEKGGNCKPVDLFLKHPVAPAAAPAALRSKPEPSRRLTVEQAKRLVEHDLRDPEATHYREVFRSPSGAVCGQMNAKNGLGGYVGYVDFIVTPDRNEVLTREDYGRFAFDSAYAKHCGRAK
jgi:hypothetical protein